MKTVGFRAWGSGQFFFVISVLGAVVFAILSNEIVHELNLSESDLGLLGGVFFATYALSQLILGILIGKVGARALLGLAAIVSALGTFAFSLSSGLASAVVARALMGLGFGSTFVGVIYLAGKYFHTRFALMSAVSQSVANVCAAALALASAFHMVASFRPPFEILAGLFAFAALLIFLCIHDRPATEPAEISSMIVTLKAVVAHSQFWAALVFYCGTFGTLLAFADLWNIQFQMNFFAHTVQQSAVMNAMIPLGVTAGGLIAGAWAGRVGFIWPARVFVLLLFTCFAVLLLFPLPLAAAHLMMFVVGLGFGGSILGLAAIHQHLSPGATSLATSLVVTAACIFGGVIQPLVGSAISAPHRIGELLNLVSSPNPDFGTYQRGLIWLLISVGGSVVASFSFRTPLRAAASSSCRLPLP